MGLPSAISLGVYPMEANASSVKNEFGTNAFRTREMVHSNTAEYARMREGVLVMVRQATEERATSLALQKNIVPVTERDAAQEFSAVIIQFSSGELAQAAKRSKEAAKAWKEGRSLPTAWSMLNMAREIPAVRNWMLAKLGADPQFNSPEMLSVLVGAVQTVAAMPGMDGDRLRALIAGPGKVAE